MYVEIICFILLTILFFICIYKNKRFTRCNKYTDYKEFQESDGNGENQYLGRGSPDESVSELLNRIDWTAKHSNVENYSKSYITSYCISLAVFFILWITQNSFPNLSEILLVFITSYIVTFSINNLFGFHTDKYSSYYIRQNVEYLKKVLNTNTQSLNELLELPKTQTIPHRTLIDDVLLK